MINNNTSSGSPCYDEQIIDISLAILLVISTKRVEDAQAWIKELVGRILYGFQSGHHFPIASDSFEDLIEFKINKLDSLERELKKLSTLIPTLLQWCVALNLAECYNAIVREQNGVFKETCMQLWYPEEDIDSEIYRGPAQYKSGVTEAPIIFPETITEMKKHLYKIYKLLSSGEVVDFEKLSAAAQGFSSLVFLANRHFRTPIIPSCFQVLSKTANPEKDEGAGS